MNRKIALGLGALAVIILALGFIVMAVAQRPNLTQAQMTYVPGGPVDGNGPTMRVWTKAPDMKMMVSGTDTQYCNEYVLDTKDFDKCFPNLKPTTFGWIQMTTEQIACLRRYNPKDHYCPAR